MLPALFTVSAFDTGVAAIVIILALLEKDEMGRRLASLLEVATLCLIVLESIVLAAFLGGMLGGNPSEALSAGILVDGELSVVFWTLVVGFGLAVPFAAALVQLFMARKGAHSKWLALGGAACVLVGGFTLRYVILAAGIHAMIISPDALQAAQGLVLMIP